MRLRVGIWVVLIAIHGLTRAGVSAEGQQVAKVNSPAVASKAPASGEAAAGDYVIGADDVLSVVFWRDPQLSGEVLVRPDGKISLPLLDEVEAAGLTPRQLRDVLVIEARRFVTEPVMTVVVKHINSRKVYITGQVLRPGQYPLGPSMNVLQLIATAGGLTDYAKSKDIRIMRVEQGRSISLRFDYDKVTKSTRPPQNIDLKSGDTVIVP